MRFVLVGVSLFIAWLAWWRTAHDEEPEAAAAAGAAAAKQQQRAPQQPSLGAGLCSAGATFFDMFSGRYLYRVFAHGVAHPNRAARRIKAS
jgi:hypothetical protein